MYNRTFGKSLVPSRVVSTEMANEGMSHDHGVNILRVDPSLFQPIRPPSDRRSKEMQSEQPTMSERYSSVPAWPTRVGGVPAIKPRHEAALTV